MTRARMVRLAIAIILTLVAIGVSAIALWIVTIARPSSESLEQAASRPWIPVIALAACCIAALSWLLVARGTARLATIAVAIGLAALATLVAANIIAARRDVTFSTWSCPGEFSQSYDYSRCSPLTNDLHEVYIGSYRHPHAHGGHQSYGQITMSNLPGGYVDLAIRAGSDPTTNRLILGGLRDNRWQPIAHLDPDYPAIGNVMWTGLFTIQPGHHDMRLFTFASTQSPAPNASISWSVMQCGAHSSGSVDPGSCSPATDLGIVLQPDANVTLDGHRAPLIEQSDATVQVTNLETGSYRFTPLITNAWTTRNRYQVLVLPVGSTDPADNLLAWNPDWQSDELVLPIDHTTGPIEFVVYVFERDSQRPSASPSAGHSGYSAQDYGSTISTVPFSRCTCSSVNTFTDTIGIVTS